MTSGVTPKATTIVSRGRGGRCDVRSAERKVLRRRPEPGDPPWVRNALVLACLALVALVAVTVLGWSVSTLIARLRSSASPRSSTSSPVAATGRPTIYQLRAGDCLQDTPGLYLGTGSQWPEYFNVVSCAKQHTAEVFLADNAWPSGLAYPGDNKADSQADARCNTAFRAYDGINNSRSEFTYEYSRPDNTAWANGDRRLLCIA